jgi:hypothetical protein
MKGGENLGLNSDLGNIILSLTNFDFYIKLQANDGVKVQPSDADGEIYYFVFDLTDNHFVTEYGLFKDLLINGNKPTILSKTFSEMKDVAGGTEVKLQGKAYKQNSTTNTLATIKFNEIDGKKSTLQINVNPNYVPFYKLTINDGTTPVASAFTTSIKPNILSNNANDAVCTLDNIITNLEGITVLKAALQPYDENNQTNKDTLNKLLSLEDETIKCINYALNKNIQEVVSQPDDAQIPEIQSNTNNIVANSKKIYALLLDNYNNFLFVNSNYLINSTRFDLTPDKYQNALSLIVRYFNLLEKRIANYPGADFTLMPVIPRDFTSKLQTAFGSDKTYLPEPKIALDKDETKAAKAAAAKAATAASTVDANAAATGPEKPQGVFERFFNNLVTKIKNGLTNKKDFDTKIKPWVFTIYRQTSTAPLQNISMRENYSMVFVSKLTQFINDNEEKIKNNQITTTDISALSKEINDSTNASSTNASEDASINASEDASINASEDASINASNTVSNPTESQTQPPADETPEIDYKSDNFLSNEIINSMVANFFRVPLGNINDVNIQTQIYVLKSRFKDFLKEESVENNEDYFNDCFERLQSFILKDKRTYYVDNSKNKNFINNFLYHVYLNLYYKATPTLQLTQLYKQTQSGGLGGFGATTFAPNCKAIIELSSDSLNISDFSEPIIYLNKSDAKFGNVVKFNTLPGAPIFPYLTVGKPLLQKLNELTANYNSKFEVPPPFSKKVTSAIINWIMKNKLLTLSGVTFVANKIQNYLIENAAANPDSWYGSFFKDQTGIKRIITDLLNKVFGDWQKIPIFGTFVSSCITMFTYILSHPGFSAAKLDKNGDPLIVDGVAQMWTTKDIPSSQSNSITTLPEFLKWVSEKNAEITSKNPLDDLNVNNGDSLGGNRIFKKNKNTKKRVNKKKNKTSKRKVKKNRRMTKKRKLSKTKKN